MSSARLSIDNLKICYGDFTAVSGLSFELGAGEIFCLAGESGCGKSSVLRAIMGVDTAVRAEGEIRFDGTKLSALDARRRRELCGAGVALIPQNPGASFNPLRSYGAQLKEMLRSHGRYRRSAFFGEVEAALEKMGLRDAPRILRSRPYALSGGMNQRIAIAAAMLLRPGLLLADEPTSALDAGARRQVEDALLRLRDETGAAQIIVTHDLNLAARVADSIGVMYAGRMVERGAARAVLERPAHPYTRALLAAIPRPGGPMPEALEGRPPLDGATMTGCAFRFRCARRTADCAHANMELAQIEPEHWSACCREACAHEHTT